MAKSSILIKWVSGLLFHNLRLIYDIKIASWQMYTSCANKDHALQTYLPALRIG